MTVRAASVGGNATFSVLTAGSTATNNLRTFPTSRTGAVSLNSASTTVNLADATTAAFTITLPAVATSTGYVFTFKKTDASINAVTVQANGAELIDAANTYSLASQYKYVTIVCDGTKWHIIANN